MVLQCCVSPATIFGGNELRQRSPQLPHASWSVANRTATINPRQTDTHARTHARTHLHTHACTHALTHACLSMLSIVETAQRRQTSPHLERIIHTCRQVHTRVKSLELSSNRDVTRFNLCPYYIIHNINTVPPKCLFRFLQRLISGCCDVLFGSYLYYLVSLFFSADHYQCHGEVASIYPK